MSVPQDPRATGSFFSLTPERVLEAVEAAGLEVRPLCYPLNSFENRVYEVELADRSRIIAKFYRPGRWTAEQILEEHRFLTELEADEIPVVAPLPFPGGATLERIDDIYYALFERRGGRAPDELADGDVERLGRLVARVHNVGARSAAPSRPRLDADHYVREKLAWLDEHATIPPGLAPRYFAAARAIADVADERMEGVATQRIHADLHLGNILFRDGLMRLLDFDDMVAGPPVQDLWLALPGRDAETDRRRRLFLDAYEQLRDFDRSTLHLIEPLRGLRLVRYAAWLARRWHDPAFRLAWPHFGTEEYWESETRDLEEQLAIVRRERPLDARGAPVPSPAADETAEEEPELTNKDYFWDWEGD